MHACIQPLESRVLFSASSITAATLIADKAKILADQTSVKANVEILFTEGKAEAKLITLAFKTLPKADQSLLKLLTTDSDEGGEFVAKDVALLLTPGSALVNKSVAAGEAVLKNATAGSLAAEAKDTALLQTVTNIPLGALQALFADTKLTDFRESLIAEFPTATALDSALSTELTNSAAGKSAISAAAVEFQTDIATLDADLTTLHADLGTFPSMVGTFTGTAKELHGAHVALTATSSLVITSENALTGALTGTVEDLSTGQTDFLTGAVSLNGKYILKASKANVSGTITGTTLVGTFKFGSTSGTYVFDGLVP